MKVKSLVFSVCVLSLLASCSKDETNGMVDNGATKTVELSIQYAGTQTRAIQDPSGVTPTLTNVMAEFLNATNGVVMTQPIPDPTTITAFKVPALATSVRVVANSGGATKFSSDVVWYQNKLATTDIPYEGKANLTQVGGTETYTATVKIAPAVARIEVSGVIEKATALQSTITIDAVYMNNFVPDSTDPNTLHTLQSDGNVDDPKIVDPMGGMFDSNTTANFTDAFPTTAGTLPTKAAAFHLFAGQDLGSYGVVLAVTRTLGNNETINGIPAGGTIKGFIVVKSFSTTKNGAGIDKLEAGKIYKLTLNANSGIADGFEDGKPVGPITPDPSGEEKDVTVTVTVTDWTEQNVFPNL